ncbi:hypothetical protein PM082_023346 [Marasmius tenuissimus]|nr:hypothetical protein PM082_023346 [Marasmius tenuissimus]
MRGWHTSYRSLAESMVNYRFLRYGCSFTAGVSPYFLVFDNEQVDISIHVDRFSSILSAHILPKARYKAPVGTRLCLVQRYRMSTWLNFIAFFMIPHTDLRLTDQPYIPFPKLLNKIPLYGKSSRNPSSYHRYPCLYLHSNSVVTVPLAISPKASKIMEYSRSMIYLGTSFHILVSRTLPVRPKVCGSYHSAY